MKTRIKVRELNSGTKRYSCQYNLSQWFIMLFLEAIILFIAVGLTMLAPFKQEVALGMIFMFFVAMLLIMGIGVYLYFVGWHTFEKLKYTTKDDAPPFVSSYTNDTYAIFNNEGSAKEFIDLIIKQKEVEKQNEWSSKTKSTSIIKHP